MSTHRPSARNGTNVIRRTRFAGGSVRIGRNMIRPLGDRGEDGRDRLRGSAGRGVDDQVAAVPGLVLPAGDLLPVRQPQAGDVHLAGPGPLAVRDVVRADELDLDQAGAMTGRDVTPGVPGHAERGGAFG